MSPPPRTATGSRPWSGPDPCPGDGRGVTADGGPTPRPWRSGDGADRPVAHATEHGHRRGSGHDGGRRDVNQPLSGQLVRDILTKINEYASPSTQAASTSCSP